MKSPDFLIPLGNSALIKAHVVSKSQLMYPTEAVRAKITLNVTCEVVGEKEKFISDVVIKY